MSLYERIITEVLPKHRTCCHMSRLLCDIKPILDEYERKHTTPKYPRWFVAKNQNPPLLRRIDGPNSFAQLISCSGEISRTGECESYYVNLHEFYTEITQEEASVIIEKAKLNARWKPPAADGSTPIDTLVWCRGNSPKWHLRCYAGTRNGEHYAWAFGAIEATSDGERAVWKHMVLADPNDLTAKPPADFVPEVR